MRKSFDVSIIEIRIIVLTRFCAMKINKLIKEMSFTRIFETF